MNLFFDAFLVHWPLWVCFLLPSGSLGGSWVPRGSILMILGANKSWGLACVVSAVCLLLLFSGKRQKLQEKFRSLFSRLFLGHPCVFAMSVMAGACSWTNRYQMSRNNQYILFKQLHVTVTN